MASPGSNQLLTALRAIGSTPVQYYRFSSRTENSAGIDVTTYIIPQLCILGSFQPVKRQLYERMGLDLSKRYADWYVPNVEAVDLDRDVSGDVIEVNGRRWELVGENDWFSMDGWKSMLCVDIGPATGNLNNE